MQTLHYKLNSSTNILVGNYSKADKFNKYFNFAYISQFLQKHHTCFNLRINMGRTCQLNRERLQQARLGSNP